MPARLRSRLRWLFRRSRAESEMDTELRWHFDQYVEHLTHSGLPHEEAQRRARLELGDIEIQKEKCRDSLGLRFLDEMGDDIRFALRSLRKERLLAANIVITLTLGIGISSGVFTLVDAIALRPPVDQDRASYVSVYSFFTMDAARPASASTATLEDYLAFRSKARSLREVVASASYHLNFESDHLNATRALLVSDNYFSLYYLEKARLGRLLQPEDYLASSPVVVLSEDSWRDRFAADPKIVGKTIHVNDQPVTVVGVAPPFAGQDSGVEAWLPYTLTTYLGLGEQWTQPGVVRWLDLAGRLNPRYSRADAASELALLLSQQDKPHPGRKSSVIVTDGSAIRRPGGKRIVLMIALLAGVLILVLLISCANVTTLLLSRADARQQEMGVRLAMGARRIRLIRMLLTETVLLASIAGVASLYFTYHLPILLCRWLSETTIGYSLDPDWRVFSYLAASILLAGTLAGLAPALESLKVDILSSLKGRRMILHPRGRRWEFRHSLIAAQVAISMVLVAGAGLFMRAHRAILSADPGFETRQVVLATIFVSSAKTPEARARFRDIVSRQIEVIPGVQFTALGGYLPFSSRLEQMEIQFPGKSAFGVASSQVSAHYFSTLGIPILRGRAIEHTDASCGARIVCPVVISQEFAREYLNGSDVIGKTLRTPDGGTMEIVGIAANVFPAPAGGEDQPIIYRPVSLGAPPLQIPLSVRVTGNAESMSATIAAVLRAAYPTAEVNARTIRSVIEEMAEGFGRLEILIVILGMIGMFLAIIGIYGVVSFAVTKRTREMGIRIALGAMKKDIYATVLESSLRPIWIGLIIGVSLALAGARVMQQAVGRLFAMAYFDPFTYVAPACLMLVVSLVAMMGPARRAAACDPSTTLREE